MTMLPASAKLASVLNTFSAAGSLLSGRPAAAEEPIHLLHQHLKHLLAAFNTLKSGESVSCRQNTVRVNTRLAVETVPDDSRQVEQHRLRFARQKGV